MKDFLFEVYTEEMPAKLINNLSSQMREIFQKKLMDYNLKYGGISSFGTPRRLVIYLKDVNEKEEDKMIEIKGPSLKIAYDELNKETEVLKKFLENNNLTRNDIQIRDIKGNKYVFGYKKLIGRAAQEILSDVSLYTLTNLSFPRGMRWNDSNVVFIRPIRNILALFGEELINIEYAGITSSKKSYGFYFDSPIEFSCENPLDYFKKLRERYVILDFAERKKIVEKETEKLASSVGGKVKLESDFLEEVVNLTEFPTPFLCEINLGNFNVPDCVVESVVKDHLKSFPIFSKDMKKIIPYFIGVRNGTSDFIENVKRGYEKVAIARLYDAAFFFEEDKKEKLESRIEKLKDIIFISGLGSLYDKTQRLLKISKFLSDALSLDENKAKLFEKACLLSKADITTQIVKEFPELQGIIGGIYAKLEGIEVDVSDAISEQYLPRYADDELPRTEIGKYLSIIDKLDTLVLSIGKGIEFTSSKDPLGLRRNALQIVQVVLSLPQNEFPITQLINFIYTLTKLEKDNKTVMNELITLLRDRANYFIRSSGISYDSANAVTNLNIDLLPTFFDRARTIEKYSKDEKFKEIVVAHKRMRNMLHKTNYEEGSIREELLIEKEEEELLEVTKESTKIIYELLKNRDYDAIIHLLYLYVSSVNKFFDNVLVMDNNENIRNNRLALISNVLKVFESFALFSEVVIEK